MLHEVTEEEFIHEIVERGNVESASNVEIRCEVKARGKNITILEIIPEGTYVNPGDVLVKLDSSSFESDLLQQQIKRENSRATMVKAENDLKTANIALREYVEGTFVKEKLTIRAEIEDKTRLVSQAKDYYDYSEKLERKGYVTRVQLEADKAQWDKAKTEMEVAEKKMFVLEEFTQEKMIIQLQSDIDTAKANFESKKAAFQLDEDELKLIEEQIELCILKATDSGQVVYANQTDRRGGQEIIIEPGLQVRERQTIIRLPDPKRMQVKAKINEAKINLIADGQEATIRLDAFPEMRIEGAVTKVDEYPAPTGWFTANVKEYGTIIGIKNESLEGKSVGLRPGLTAEVRILVEYIPKAVIVPVQAVIEHGNRYYCLLWNDGAFEEREVKIGSTNDTVLVIEEGLKPGEEVVLNANGYRDRVDLPEVEEEQSTRNRRKPTSPPNGDKRGGSKRGGAEAGRAAGGPGRPGGGNARPGGGSGRPGSGGPPSPDALFARADKNKDGKLQADELPEQMRPMIKRADKDKDGALSKAEMTAAFSAMRGGGPGGPGGNQPGGNQSGGGNRPGGRQ